MIALHPSDIKILCPRHQRAKDKGAWYQPISCRDCRLINILSAAPQASGALTVRRQATPAVAALVPPSTGSHKR